MGFKRNDYELVRFGVTIPQAYARLNQLDIDVEGNAHAFFGISKARDDERYFETKVFDCRVDKNQPVHEQVYVAAKEAMFQNWEDDIVE